MKSKETVMTYGQRSVVVQGKVRLAKPDDHLPRILSHNVEDALLKAQAKISFQAGMKEVVEWGNEECDAHPYTSRLKGEAYNRKRHRCPECWQAFLKERGIE